MTAEAASRGELAKEHIVTVPFPNLAEAVIVALRRSGEAGGHNVLFSNDRLKGAAEVIPSCVKRFSVQSTGLCERLTGKRAAVTILVRDAASDEGSFPAP